MTNLKFEICDDMTKKKNKKVKVFYKDQEIYTRIRKKNGVEYFSVPNYLSPFSSDFNNRLKDALDTVKNGDGDSISIRCIEPYIEFLEVTVSYYLDRNVGEVIRQKTIDEYKNFFFSYYIYFDEYILAYLTEKEMFHNSRLHYHVNVPIIDARMYFESEKEAMRKIEEIYTETEKLILNGNFDDISSLKTPLERSASIFVDINNQQEPYVVKALRIGQDARLNMWKNKEV